jgi:hypothetical protein
VSLRVLQDMVEESRTLPSPADPMAVAREFVRVRYTDTKTGVPTLRLGAVGGGDG